MDRAGKIIPNGVILKEHEMATVVLFTEKGFDVELIPKSNIQGRHTPDIRMCGLEWEIKAPEGEGKSLMKNTLQKTALQSENVIIDLRRVKRYEDKCINEIKREFMISRRVKRLKVITKSKILLAFEK